MSLQSSVCLSSQSVSLLCNVNIINSVIWEWNTLHLTYTSLKHSQDTPAWPPPHFHPDGAGWNTISISMHERRKIAHTSSRLWDCCICSKEHDVQYRNMTWKEKEFKLKWWPKISWTREVKIISCSTGRVLSLALQLRTMRSVENSRSVLNNKN